MRHHGPTDAVAPGLYADASRRLGSPCDLTAVSSGASAALNHHGVFVAASAAVTTSFSNISPVLSRLTSSIPRLCTSTTKSTVHPSSPSLSQRTPLTMCQANDLQEHLVSEDRDCKRRKHPKTRRRNLRSNNGDNLRNWHSLKLTIKRTSHSHHVHPPKTESLALHPNLDHGAVNSSSANKSSYVSKDFSSGEFSSGTTIPALGLIDACTSTSECAILTEPNPSGPCEPGTKVVVEGVVWLETTDMLVLNVKWRGKQYMGTFLEASRCGLAPSCTDKGITSALTLLNSRRSWALGSGNLRTRGLRRFPRHRRSGHALHSRCRDEGGTMTTRAAAAARATAATPTTASVDSDSTHFCGSSTGSKTAGPQEKDINRLSVYDLDIDLPVDRCPGRASQRGGKRRRRRGTGVGRPYRRVATGLRNRSDSSSVTEVAIPVGEVSSPSGSTVMNSEVSFECLFSGCGKKFSDLVNMRYHLATEHGDSTQELTVSEPMDGHFGVIHNSETLTKARSTIHSTPTSPPKLSRVHSIGNSQAPIHDGTSYPQVSPDEQFDDNRAPPRLQRIVSIVDVPSQVPHDSSPSEKRFRSFSPSDEPPAPSPAYSDISDDGAAPVDPPSKNQLNGGGMPIDDKNSNMLFGPSQTILSSLASFIPRQSGLLTSSMASPGIPSGLRQTCQPGLYLPVNLISTQQSSVVSSASLPSAMIPSDGYVRNTTLSSVHKYTPGSGISYDIVDPLTLTPVIPLTRIPPPPSPSYIPGVNSFCAPTSLNSSLSRVIRPPSFNLTERDAQYRRLGGRTSVAQSSSRPSVDMSYRNAGHSGTVPGMPPGT